MATPDEVELVIKVQGLTNLEPNDRIVEVAKAMAEMMCDWSSTERQFGRDTTTNCQVLYGLMAACAALMAQHGHAGCALAAVGDITGKLIQGVFEDAAERDEPDCHGNYVQ